MADGQIGLGFGVTTLPHMLDFNINGPFAVTGVSESPSPAADPVVPSEDRERRARMRRPHHPLAGRRRRTAGRWPARTSNG